AATPAALRDALTALGVAPQAITLAADPAHALQGAAARCGAADRIVVFGSFYTVGGVLEHGVPQLRAPHLP
ncbi:MAG: bifunctional folylpolyglutamate synthase/dihydrofolate synthase, partial [Betaproteobacteria bacterium]|nr:bifunctional folylpolyglutamate synthase/dihydrofolate synthase [Betaproteobacteria bacterium]